MDTDLKETALLMMQAWSFDRNSARGDATEELLQFRYMLDYGIAKLCVSFDTLKLDLDWRLHRLTRA